MKIIDTKLKDCYIIEPDVFNDERGYFMEFYSDKKMDKARNIYSGHRIRNDTG